MPLKSPHFLRFFFLFMLLEGCSSDTLAPVDLKVEKPSLEEEAPEARSYIVQPGDTLATISSRLGVCPQKIAEANHLLPPYALAEGQTLLCPPPSSDKPPRASFSSEPEEESSAPQSGWHSDVQVTFLPGEEEPPKAVEKTLSERLRDLRLEEEARKKKSPPSQEEKKAKEPSKEEKKTKESPKEEWLEQDKEETSPPSPKSKKDAPLAGSARLSWPIKGEVLSSFGQGNHADGICISGKAGTPVLVADDGLVVYAGAKLKSFGNLVLVKHESGLMTAYAHLGKISVNKGDYVDRGQSVGTVGKTGDTTGEQLYFEVRKNKKPVDPMIHLPKKD
ncbi:MAG: M23 family metallopeptidase [Holosporales bacterium]|jgi:murein DD-endopeptidase MepM/ murein hydrolase activator NlpD|nr:M23 family metallopeptidase [Holosporales bacterium]